MNYLISYNDFYNFSAPLHLRTAQHSTNAVITSQHDNWSQLLWSAISLWMTLP